MITGKLLWRVECNVCKEPMSTHSTPHFDLLDTGFGGIGVNYEVIPAFSRVRYTGSHICELCQAKLKTEQTK